MVCELQVAAIPFVLWVEYLESGARLSWHMCALIEYLQSDSVIWRSPNLGSLLGFHVTFLFSAVPIPTFTDDRGNQ